MVERREKRASGSGGDRSRDAWHLAGKGDGERHLSRMRFSHTSHPWITIETSFLSKVEQLDKLVTEKAGFKR